MPQEFATSPAPRATPLQRIHARTVLHQGSGTSAPPSGLSKLGSRVKIGMIVCFRAFWSRMSLRASHRVGLDDEVTLEKVQSASPFGTQLLDLSRCLSRSNGAVYEKGMSET